MYMKTRRQFLASSAACENASAVSFLIAPSAVLAASPTVLRAESRIIDVGGRATKVFGLARKDGKQGLALEAGQDFREPRCDTVWLPPQSEVTVPFDTWKPRHGDLHCHHLHHTATGMMTVVEYVG